MSASKLKTPLDMFYHWEKTTPERVALRQPRERVFREYKFSEVADTVRRMATALQTLGLEPGDRVAILSKNCAEWFMADVAIMMAGYVSVPLYPNQNAEITRYILDHSAAKVIFTGKLDDWKALEEGIPEGVVRVSLPYPGMKADHAWEDLIKANEPMQGHPHRNLDDIATIVYTSGTTGNPKGVVHTFRSIAFAASKGVAAIGAGLGDRVISYLPLSHVAERALVEIASLYSGMQISFAESLDTFVEDIQMVQPTIFFSVPRLWTRFQMGVLEKLPEKKMAVMLRIPVLGKLVAKKIRTGLGLNSTRCFISGAAAISPATLKWYKRLGMEIQEGYGMTENFAFGHFNMPGNVKVGTVGTVMPGGEVKIAENGEICSRSTALMQGYYLEPEKTAETIVDGWLMTGDKGEIDADGFLRITGRVKDIFKTTKGKYVAPAPIEGKISENTDIEQVCVMGNNMPQPVAVLVLSESAQDKSKAELNEELNETLNEVNAQLDAHERLDRFIVGSEAWSVENGMLTPTLKVKRHTIEEKYQTLAEESAGGDKVIWQGA